MTRVLICDDHRSVADALALVLERAGHDVVAVVNDPDDALHALEETPADVCVLDLPYGDKDGLDTIPVIADRHPGVRIVVFSGHLDDDAVGRALAAGASACGLKRGDLASVVALVVGDDDPRLETAGRDRWAEDPLACFLTRREREILEGLARGETTTRLAARFGVRDATIRTHTQSILSKLGVHRRAEAVAYAVRRSLIPVGPVPSAYRHDATAASAP